MATSPYLFPHLFSSRLHLLFSIYSFVRFYSSFSFLLLDLFFRSRLSIYFVFLFQVFLVILLFFCFILYLSHYPYLRFSLFFTGSSFSSIFGENFSSYPSYLGFFNYFQLSLSALNCRCSLNCQ